MKILPINNFILVEVDEETEKTESGLLVPGVKGEKTEAYAIRAIVSEVSKTAYQFKWTFDTATKDIYQVKKGDKVLVTKWEGQNVSANGKSYILIKPEHVMALIK